MTASNACQSNGVHHSLHNVDTGAIGRYFNHPPAARNIGCTPLPADVGHISSQNLWCKKLKHIQFSSICLVSTTLLAVILIFLEMFLIIGFLSTAAPVPWPHLWPLQQLVLALPFLDLPATNDPKWRKKLVDPEVTC